MDLFADNALRILDVAVDGYAGGHESSTLTFLTEADEGLVILSNTEEPLEQLRRARGASAAYRVAFAGGEFLVKGVAAGRTICLSRSPKRTSFLAMPSDLALYSVVGLTSSGLPSGRHANPLN